MQAVVQRHSKIFAGYTKTRTWPGPSRKNYRIESALLSKQSRALLDAFGEWSWYDASIITALPGRGRQPAHRDYSAPEKVGGSWKLVSFSPAHDVVRTGGVTVVYPGTHFGADATGTKRIRLDEGDELFFFSTLLHYGAANSTDTPRILLSQTFDARPNLAIP